MIFATLALGDHYNMHASFLAMDMARMSPDRTLLVLTDRPAIFKTFANVRAVAHKQRSAFRCYHDKRFAIANALAVDEYCVYLDADCRLLDNPPSEPPGSTGKLLARGVSALGTKYELELSREAADAQRGITRRTTAARRFGLVAAAAKELGVDLDRVSFVPEGAFAVHRNNNDAARWLDAWDHLARYFEVRGYSWGEGDAIGIAAEYAGWQIHEWRGVEAWLFNEAYFTSAKSTGQDDALTIERLSQEHRAIDRLFHEHKRRMTFKRSRSLHSTMGQAGRYLLLLAQGRHGLRAK